MFYRAVRNGNYSTIGYCKLDGPVQLVARNDTPLIIPYSDDASKGVEDPRIVIIDGVFYITYTAYNGINAFQWNWEIPNYAVKVKVENAWVTLEGELQWNYQRETAKRLVDNLVGVHGVTNNISIKTELKDKLEAATIMAAINRNWSVNSNEIDVTVLDKKVTLSGQVHSLYQKHQAEKTVWNTPGVWFVENNLVVGFEE